MQFVLIGIAVLAIEFVTVGLIAGSFYLYDRATAH